MAPSSSSLFIPKKKKPVLPPPRPSGLPNNPAPHPSIPSHLQPQPRAVSNSSAGPSSPRSNRASSLNVTGPPSRPPSAPPVAAPPAPPRSFREFQIFSPIVPADAQMKLHVMRFTKGDPRAALFNREMMLNRKDPTLEPTVAAERGPWRQDPMELYILGQDGQPILGADGQPMLKPVKAKADLSLIAPDGGAKAAKDDSKNKKGKGGGRFQFQKKQQVKSRNNQPPEYWAGVNQEKLPWVLEPAQVASGSGSGSVKQEPTAGGVERWAGRVEAQEGKSTVAMVFVNEANGAQHVEMFKIDKEYRFDPIRNIAALDSDDVSKLVDDSLAGKGKRRNLFAGRADRAPSSIPVGSAMDIDQLTSVKEEYRAPRNPFMTGLQRQLAARDDLVDRKPRIKRETFVDEKPGMIPGIERLEGEDLDYDEGVEHQDDEEGFHVGAEEEENAKRLEGLQKSEYDMANRNVGVLERDSDDEEDLFAERGRSRNRKLRKILKKETQTEVHESDSDSSNEYAESEEYSSDADTVKDQPAKGKETAVANGNGDASPSPSPVKSAPARARSGSPASRRTASPTGSNAGRRSQTPEGMSRGAGHRELAGRALSPSGSRSRAATPQAGNSSRSNKRKSDNRISETEPAPSSSRDGTFPNKKPRHTVDSPDSSYLSDESRNVVVPKVEIGPNDAGPRVAEGFKPPAHKKRANPKKSAGAGGREGSVDSSVGREERDPAKPKANRPNKSKSTASTSPKPPGSREGSPAVADAHARLARSAGIPGAITEREFKSVFAGGKTASMSNLLSHFGPRLASSGQQMQRLQDMLSLFTTETSGQFRLT